MQRRPWLVLFLLAQACAVRTAPALVPSVEESPVLAHLKAQTNELRKLIAQFPPPTPANVSFDGMAFAQTRAWSTDAAKKSWMGVLPVEKLSKFKDSRTAGYPFSPRCLAFPGETNFVGVYAVSSEGPYQRKEGILVLENGDEYVGSFDRSTNLPSQGIWFLANGGVFSGKVSGQTWVSGTASAHEQWQAFGTYEAGLLNGPGSISFSYGPIAYAKGVFQKGVLQGSAEISFREGAYEKVAGTFVNGVANGLITVSFRFGGRLFSQFRNGVPSGRGTLTFPDGRTLAGDYQWLDSEYLGGTYKGYSRDGVPIGPGSWVGQGGDRFEGWHIDGKRAFRGLSVTSSGEEYRGEFSNGLAEGSGSLRYPDNASFSGEFSAGWPAQGAMTQPDGTRYIGNFSRGQREGFGVEVAAGSSAMNLHKYRKGKLVLSRKLDDRCQVTLPSGWLYAGTGCKEGLAHGRGEFVSKELGQMVVGGIAKDGILVRGEVVDLIPGQLGYLGKLKDGLAEGQGLVRKQQTGGTTKLVQMYRGEFRAGKYHGHGQLFEGVALVYRGGFHEGEKSGEGQLFSPGVPEPVYEGQFSADLFSGIGTLSEKDGRYEGQFLAGKKHGIGTQYGLAGGKRLISYQGSFWQGEPHGQGQCLFEGQLEPCSVDRGERVDALNAARLATKRAEEARAEAELRESLLEQERQRRQEEREEEEAKEREREQEEEARSQHATRRARQEEEGQEMVERAQAAAMAPPKGDWLEDAARDSARRGRELQAQTEARQAERRESESARRGRELQAEAEAREDEQRRRDSARREQAAEAARAQAAAPNSSVTLTARTSQPPPQPPSTNVSPREKAPIIESPPPPNLDTECLQYFLGCMGKDKCPQDFEPCESTTNPHERARCLNKAYGAYETCKRACEKNPPAKCKSMNDGKPGRVKQQ